MLKNWVASGNLMYVDGRFYGTNYHSHALSHADEQKT